MALDVKDRRILYELDLNSRQTNKQIAKKCRLSEQTAGYRIRRLVEQDIIRNFYLKTNTLALGYIHFKVFLRLQNIPAAEEKAMLQFLKDSPRVLWLAQTRGNYDVVISVLAEDVGDFGHVYGEFAEKYGKFVLQRDVILLERVAILSRSYLLGREPVEFAYGGRKDAVELDNEDKKILRQLSNNARKSLVEIAKEMKASPDKVIYRMKKLEESGVITGFSVNMDFKKMGMRYYLLSFRLQNMNEQKYNRFKELSKRHRCVFYFMKTIGSHDVELEVEIENEEQLDGLIKDIRNRFFNELREYDTLEVKNEIKLNYYPF